MNALVNQGAGVIQNHPVAGVTAIATAVFGAISMISWVIANQDKIIHGANTAMAVKDCVLNNKIKSQRDSCFHALDYLRDNLTDLKSLNISDYNQTKDRLGLVVQGVGERNFALQWIDDMNQRTQNVWNSFDEETKSEMIERGLFPNTLTLLNIPKSAADMAIWIKEAGDCTNNFKDCLAKKAKCEDDRERAIQASFNTKDELSQSKDKHKHEIDPLLIRSGKCEELESIKVEKSRLAEVEKKCIKTEAERDSWKEKYETLNKEYEESKKWFFRRWTGL